MQGSAGPPGVRGFQGSRGPQVMYLDMYLFSDIFTHLSSIPAQHLSSVLT